jgi:hypothetical protein
MNYETIIINESDISNLLKGEEKIVSKLQEDAYNYGLNEGRKYTINHGTNQNVEEYSQKTSNGYIKMILYPSLIASGLKGEKMLKKAEKIIKKNEKNKYVLSLKSKVSEGFNKVAR